MLALRTSDLFLEKHEAVLQQQDVQRLHPLGVAELHGEAAVVEHGVVGEVQAAVLPVDGVVGPHLVQARGVEAGLDLHQLLPVQLVGHLQGTQENAVMLGSLKSFWESNGFLVKFLLGQSRTTCSLI